jgi:hypothetical protein
LALVVVIVVTVYAEFLGRVRGIVPQRPDLQARLNTSVVRSGVAAGVVAVLILTLLCAFLVWRASRPNRILLGLADAAVLIMVLAGPALAQRISADRSSFQGFMEPWIDYSPLIVTLPSTAAVLGALVFWVSAVRKARRVPNAA